PLRQLSARVINRTSAIAREISKFAIFLCRHRAVKNLPPRCLRSFQTNCPAIHPVGLERLDREVVPLQDPERKIHKGRLRVQSVSQSVEHSEARHWATAC